jgi:hypothetical protein
MRMTSERSRHAIANMPVVALNGVRYSTWRKKMAIPVVRVTTRAYRRSNS